MGFITIFHDHLRKIYLGHFFQASNFRKSKEWTKYKNLGGGNAKIVYLHQRKVKQHIAIEILGGGCFCFTCSPQKIREDEPIFTSMFHLEIGCFSPPLGRNFLGDARNLSGLLAGLGAWASKCLRNSRGPLLRDD